MAGEVAKEDNKIVKTVLTTICTVPPTPRQPPPFNSLHRASVCEASSLHKGNISDEGKSDKEGKSDNLSNKSNKGEKKDNLMGNNNIRKKINNCL